MRFVMQFAGEKRGQIAFQGASVPTHPYCERIWFLFDKNLPVVQTSHMVSGQRKESKEGKMRVVRKLEASEIEQFEGITRNAYPGWAIDAPDRRKRFREMLIKEQDECPNKRMYGLFDDGMLMGGMRIFDFEMNFHGKIIPVTGIGLVAVDLLQKKKKVARDMLAWYHQYCVGKKTAISILYPFRPDFYYKMGYGHGILQHFFRLRPEQLPASDLRDNVEFLSINNLTAVQNCYERVLKMRHGMIRQQRYDFEKDLKNPVIRWIGYRKGSKITAYAIFGFEKVGKNPLTNDIKIYALVYENTESLRGILGFLQAQLDQINEILLPMFDESLLHLMADPRHTSRELVMPVYHETYQTGMGFMYRVMDVPQAIMHYPWQNVDCAIRFRIEDDFLPGAKTRLAVRWEAGKPAIAKERKVDATLEMTIQNFSSLMVGAISIDKCLAFGLCGKQNPNSEALLKKLFGLPEKPWAITQF